MAQPFMKWKFKIHTNTLTRVQVEITPVNDLKVCFIPHS